MKLYQKLTYIIIAALPLIVSSCGDDDDGIGWASGSGTPSGYKAPTSVTSRMECPRLKGDANEQLIAHWTTNLSRDSIMTYCLAYDLQKRHSRWVAFRYDAQTRDRAVGRWYAGKGEVQYPQDPSVPNANALPGDALYGSGYNHGHLCASQERLYSQQANKQTFYMTNMSPQLGAFNQGYWVTLENQVNSLGRDKNFADTLYVVKGGTITEGKILRTLTLAGGRQMPVPKYYYMALLKVKNGVYSSIAFMMEHKQYGYSYEKQAPLSEMVQHAMTVNELEQQTGIDFFCNLPDSQEESIESQRSTSAWGVK